MPRSLGIHHVQISIAPGTIERSRDFYVNFLGMTPIADPFNIEGFWLGAGEQQVHARVEPGVDRGRTRAHPAFVVEDLTDCRKMLSDAGHEIIDQPKMEGFDRFHVLDPSGNRLEIMQRT